MKRFELIGLDNSIPATNRLRRFIGLGNYPAHKNQRYLRQKDISAAVRSILFSYFGYESKEHTRVRAIDGFEVALDLFFGDWWQVEKERWDTAQEKNESLHWYEPFVFGVFMGTLAGQWQELRRLCTWITDKSKESFFGSFDIDLASIMILFAEFFGEKEIAGSVEIRESIVGGRNKRAKHLLRLLNAINERNQDEFSETVCQLLAMFSKSCPKSNFASFMDVTALIESSFVNVGILNGLHLPDIEAQLKAFLVLKEE